MKYMYYDQNSEMDAQSINGALDEWTIAIKVDAWVR